MRDVTDNRTEELDIAVKRGRGRPRKADAMTNAERQAAYRARRRARVRPMDRAICDPEALQDVAELEDDMAELRADLDATKAKLTEAHETIDELNDELMQLRAAKERLEAEVAELNQQFIKLEAERAAAKEAELVARAELVELVVQRRKSVTKDVAKSVTGNGNPVSFEDMCELLVRMKKARTVFDRAMVTCEDGGVWSRAIVRTLAVSDEQMERVRRIFVDEPKKTVTRRAVTKKGD